MTSGKLGASSHISDSVLSRLYQASPEGLAMLVKTVPAQTRAALAIYCLHREQLIPIGLTIAESCDRRDILCRGGSAAWEFIRNMRTPRQSLEDGGQQSAA
jgi:hypothetical protein